MYTHIYLNKLGLVSRLSQPPTFKRLLQLGHAHAPVLVLSLWICLLLHLSRGMRGAEVQR